MITTQKLKLLDDRHLECRSFRYHALERLMLNKTKTGDVLSVSRCTRCGAIRTDRYTRRAVLISRRYDLPTGYALTGSRPSSEEVIRELIRRANLTTASEEDARALARSLAADWTA